MKSSKRTVLQVLLLPVLLVVLVGCDQLNLNLPGSAPKDSMRVSVSGLPAYADANVSVTGPNGFEVSVGETETHLELQPGEYRVHAPDVTLYGTVFAPSTRNQVAVLQSGRSVQVSVSYGPHRDVSRASGAALNEWRVAAGLNPVRVDETGSLGHWLHSQYLAENRTGGHTQDPSNEWYTSEGAAAGQVSNVAGTSFSGIPLDWPVTAFTHAPFHMLHFMNPHATSLRVGYYVAECDTDGSTWCSDFHAATVQPVAAAAAWPAGTTVVFPPPGIELQQTIFRGESPNPLTACPEDYGSAKPAGTPLFVMVGREANPRLVGSELMMNGEALEHCAYTASGYVNDSPAAESLARNIMDYYGAIIIIPKRALEVSSEYHVHVDIAGQDSVEWSFTTLTPPGDTDPNSVEFEMLIN